MYRIDFRNGDSTWWNQATLAEYQLEWDNWYIRAVTLPSGRLVVINHRHS